MIQTSFSVQRHYNTFFTVNIELDWSSFWFIENRLLLNVKKLSALYSIDNIPLKLPDPEMAVNSVKKTSCIEFLGVMID